MVACAIAGPVPMAPARCRIIRRNQSRPQRLSRTTQENIMLKFLGGAVGIIFIIGLLVVIGILSLIF
ncbi:hypothetical protein PANO111632_06775 [Paracoccus nototheniae]